MKVQRFIAVFALVLGFSLSAQAQDLPQPSPAAKVEQRIGLTDVSVTYSRPSVKGREIWGDLVPYGEVWRVGANAATLVEISDDVKIKGKSLKAGTYAFFITPQQKGAWTVHFNTAVESWGAGDYKAENDVIALMIMPETGENVESMRFSFENLNTYTAGDMVMTWAGKSLSVPFEVEVEEKAWANIETAVAEAEEDRKWITLRNAARYSAQSGKKLNEGIKWISESIKLHESWYSYWVKSDLQKAMDKKSDAIKSLEMAIKLGEKSAKENGSEFSYKEELEGLIAEMK